ncbi:MAG TPA: type II toxin-antitoxin system Phd/YefM family antitoxin [Oscillatoriaceae cyanobacterium]
MSTNQSVTAKDARANFSELMNRALFAKERIVVTKNGKPAVAIVPVEDLEAIERDRFRAAMLETGAQYESTFRRLAE